MFYKEKITSAIYVIAGNNDIYSFNDGDGALRWHITTEEKIVGQPIIAEDGNIYLSVEEVKFYRFRLKKVQSWKLTT